MQTSEIRLLSRRIDQLQRSQETVRTAATAGTTGSSSFIIRDLQCQIQTLQEKNCKKDSLIKKCAETILRSQEMNIFSVVDTLRRTTVKPSDRRIDFDIDTLCMSI